MGKEEEEKEEGKEMEEEEKEKRKKGVRRERERGGRETGRTKYIHAKKKSHQKRPFKSRAIFFLPDTRAGNPLKHGAGFITLNIPSWFAFSSIVLIFM